MTPFDFFRLQILLIGTLLTLAALKIATAMPAFQ